MNTSNICSFDDGMAISAPTTSIVCIRPILGGDSSMQYNGFIGNSSMKALQVKT